ncbi:hypothetical protein MN608_04525 [Microdochium nivale]|nr:hypothetical protein MN608_04525 [Microdochium nivale]
MPSKSIKRDPGAPSGRHVRRSAYANSNPESAKTTATNNTQPRQSATVVISTEFGPCDKMRLIGGVRVHRRRRDKSEDSLRRATSPQLTKPLSKAYPRLIKLFEDYKKTRRLANPSFAGPHENNNRAWASALKLFVWTPLPEKLLEILSDATNKPTRKPFHLSSKPLCANELAAFKTLHNPKITKLDTVIAPGILDLIVELARYRVAWGTEQFEQNFSQDRISLEASASKTEPYLPDLRDAPGLKAFEAALIDRLFYINDFLGWLESSNSQCSPISRIPYPPSGIPEADVVLDAFLFDMGVLDHRYKKKGEGVREFDPSTDTLVLMYGVGFHELTDVQRNRNVQERAENINTLESWHALRCQLQPHDFQDISEQTKYLSYVMRNARKEHQEPYREQLFEEQRREFIITRLLVLKVAGEVRLSQSIDPQSVPRRSFPQQIRFADSLRADWHKLSISTQRKLLHYDPDLITRFIDTRRPSAPNGTTRRQRTTRPTQRDSMPQLAYQDAYTDSTAFCQSQVYYLSSGMSPASHSQGLLPTYWYGFPTDWPPRPQHLLSQPGYFCPQPQYSPPQSLQTSRGLMPEYIESPPSLPSSPSSEYLQAPDLSPPDNYTEYLERQHHEEMRKGFEEECRYEEFVLSTQPKVFYEAGNLVEDCGYEEFVLGIPSTTHRIRESRLLSPL